MPGHLNVNHLEFLIDGALWTVVLSLVALIGGGLLGFVVALARISPHESVRIPATAYVQLIQGTPLLVIMFVTYFGLPTIGWTISPLVAAGASLTINASAYLGEIWRGAIESVPKPQWEAADCQSDSSAGAQDRHASDGRLHGSDHQEHLIGISSGVCRTRAFGANHQ
jgi:polar amino acid transport system permease protein